MRPTKRLRTASNSSVTEEKQPLHASSVRNAAGGGSDHLFFLTVQISVLRLVDTKKQLALLAGLNKSQHSPSYDLQRVNFEPKRN